MATKSRSRYIKNVDWDRYKHIVQKFLEDDSGRQIIGWCKNINQMYYMGEDKAPKYTLINIEALCYYNAFRNWPINKATVAGELDDENLVILIPKSAITEYLDKNGYFKFNWSEDRFIINGIPYKPDGDTQVAQAKDEAIVFQIILKRDRDTRLLASDFDNVFGGNDGAFCCNSGYFILSKPEKYNVFMGNNIKPYKDVNGIDIGSTY